MIDNNELDQMALFYNETRYLRYKYTSPRLSLLMFIFKYLLITSFSTQENIKLWE